MKHDPLYAPPELWVLKNVGSFSFEFMGGGKAVVCGYDCEGLPSVLGERPCVGMVGGIVYVRGAFSEDAADDLAVSGLESDDIAYLDAGLETFCPPWAGRNCTPSSAIGASGGRFIPSPWGDIPLGPIPCR